MCLQQKLSEGVKTSYFWKLKKYWEETWLWCVLKGTGEFELPLKVPWWFDACNSNLYMNFFQISKMCSIFLTDTYLERCGCTPGVKCPTSWGHMTQRSLSWLQADLAEGHMTPRTCTDQKCPLVIYHLVMWWWNKASNTEETLESQRAWRIYQMIKEKGTKEEEDKQVHGGNPDECVDISWWKGRGGKCNNNYFRFFGKFRRSWPMGVFCSGIISLQIEAPLLHEIYHVTLICPHTVQQKQLNVWIGLQVPDRWY